MNWEQVFASRTSRMKASEIRELLKLLDQPDTISFAGGIPDPALFPVDEAASIIGNMAVLFCVAMFGSPLASLKTVLKTKSAKSIPLPFTLATVVNCVLWSVAGIFQMHDIKVYFPNVLGLTFGMAQVALKLMYGDSRPRLEREEPLV